MDEQQRVMIEAYDKLGKPAWRAVVDCDAEAVGRKMTEYLERGMIPVVRWMGKAQDAGEKLADVIAQMKRSIDKEKSIAKELEQAVKVDWAREGTRFHAEGPGSAVLDAQADFLAAYAQQGCVVGSTTIKTLKDKD